MTEEFKPEVLLMLSGGLDSTGAFWKLVQDGKRVHVHHMNLRNVERRALAESIAVKGIIAYMKNVTPFVYSESTHSYPCINREFIWDSDLCAFMAGNICMAAPWIRQVAMGMTASDTDPAIEKRVKRGRAIFTAFGSTAEKVYPVASMTKQKVYDMLPEGLRKLTWSCRTPNYSGQNVPSACGRCKACQEMQKVDKHEYSAFGHDQ
jgi:7-cyano-7-deazaguanine synthase in queuosine biosynthesis